MVDFIGGRSIFSLRIFHLNAEWCYEKRGSSKYIDAIEQARNVIDLFLYWRHAANRAGEIVNFSILLTLFEINFSTAASSARIWWHVYFTSTHDTFSSTPHTPYRRTRTYIRYVGTQTADDRYNNAKYVDCLLLRKWFAHSVHYICISIYIIPAEKKANWIRVLNNSTAKRKKANLSNQRKTICV